MRTTVSLDADVAAAIDRLRTTESLGLSEALNTLVRRGLAATPNPRGEYVHRTADLGIQLDVRNTGEVLDLLDAEERW